MNRLRGGAAGTVVIVILFSLLPGCIQPMKITPFGSAPSKPPECKLDIYSPGHILQKPVNLLAKVEMGDNGLNFKCNEWSAVEKEMKNKACQIGADAILILQVRSPDNESFCYRATAELVQYRALW